MKHHKKAAVILRAVLNLAADDSSPEARRLGEEVGKLLRRIGLDPKELDSLNPPESRVTVRVVPAAAKNGAFTMDQVKLTRKFRVVRFPEFVLKPGQIRHLIIDA